MPRKAGKFLVYGSILILGVSACANPDDSVSESNGDDEGSGDVVEQNPEVEEREYDSVPELVELVPSEFADEGTLAVSINPDVPPLKYVDDAGDIRGVNPDLLRAAGQLLDLEVELNQGSFDSMVPGLESQQYDLVGSINDFEERRGSIDFVDYLYAGTGMLARTDLGLDTAEPSDLCGLRVGFIVGTAQQSLIDSASENCTENGDDPIESSGYNDGGAAVTSLGGAQEDVVWIDSPAVLFNESQNPDAFEAVYLDVNPDLIYGIGVHKDNDGLRDAVQAALLELVDNGGYEYIVSEYGLEDLALPEIPINEGGSIESLE